MRLLAVDQSFTSCGLIVMEDKKVIHLERFVTDKETLDIFARAFQVAVRVDELAAGFNVDFIALEGLAFSKFGDATRDLAGLQFTIVVCVRELHGRSIEIIPPNTVKKVATGKGNAKKEDMYETLPPEVKNLIDAKKYKKTTGRYDLTDAYWIGIAAADIRTEAEIKANA